MPPVVLLIAFVGRPQHDFREVGIYSLYNLVDMILNSLAYPLAKRSILVVGGSRDELSSIYD